MLPPTHVFLQAGVGGFASSIAGYFSTRSEDKAPTVIIVEPDRAACLYESAIAGRSPASFRRSRRLWRCWNAIRRP